MLLRSISMILVLGGLALVGLAVYSYFAPPLGPALVVAKGDVELGDCAAGQDVDVVFRLQNNSGKPIPVLGMVLSCGARCCLTLKQPDYPPEFPPGPNDIECSLKINEPGTFSTDMRVYVDDQGMRDITLTVKGTAHAAETASR